MELVEYARGVGGAPLAWYTGLEVVGFWFMDVHAAMADLLAVSCYSWKLMEERTGRSESHAASDSGDGGAENVILAMKVTTSERTVG